MWVYAVTIGCTPERVRVYVQIEKFISNWYLQKNRNFHRKKLLLLLGCVAVQIMRLMLISTQDEIRWRLRQRRRRQNNILFICQANSLRLQWMSIDSKAAAVVVAQTNNTKWEMRCARTLIGVFFACMCVCTMEWQAHANTYTHMRQTLNVDGASVWVATEANDRSERKKRTRYVCMYIGRKNVANRC